jgi:predicted 3-demethylubiquinone-9 3-methyltransferase (glyoxalase superfamily)
LTDVPYRFGMPSPNVQTITPFLWFDTNAEQAAAFYTSVFKNSRVTTTSRYGDGAPMPKGTVMTVAFELAGQKFIALNGGPHFKFNESISFVVTCETQAEIDEYWEKLTSGGGKPVQCGWLTDRFGLSWQVVPAAITELVSGPNSGRVMQALMQMVKLDSAKLKAAAEGK